VEERPKLLLACPAEGKSRRRSCDHHILCPHTAIETECGRSSRDDDEPLSAAYRPVVRRVRFEASILLIDDDADVGGLCRDVRDPNLCELAETGVQVSQGLRTGCNGFFYVDVSRVDGESAAIRLSDLLGGGELVVPLDALKPVLRRFILAVIARNVSRA